MLFLLFDRVKCYLEGIQIKFPEKSCYRLNYPYYWLTVGTGSGGYLVSGGDRFRGVFVVQAGTKK